MNQEINKYLTEAMGLNRHRVVYQGVDEWECTICKEEWHTEEELIAQEHKNINFSTWDGFGQLWSWAIKQDWWWDEFVWGMKGKRKDEAFIKHTSKTQWDLDFKLINPENFANAIYNFLKEAEE